MAFGHLSDDIDHLYLRNLNDLLLRIDLRNLYDPFSRLEHLNGDLFATFTVLHSRHLAAYFHIINLRNFHNSLLCHHMRDLLHSLAHLYLWDFNWLGDHFNYRLLLDDERGGWGDLHRLRLRYLYSRLHLIDGCCGHGNFLNDRSSHRYLLHKGCGHGDFHHLGHWHLLLHNSRRHGNLHSLNLLCDCRDGGGCHHRRSGDCCCCNWRRGHHDWRRCDRGCWDRRG
mmetsp:Transcript_17942/g.41852  ORF Transcript_17942/g.41852 Transcript_17942/m.41852 type:complete len:226 (+) Transcript_17942:2050-2727(+)